MPIRLFYLGIIIILSGCSDNKPLVQYPDYFPAPLAEPERNLSSGAGIELGRQLFFDPILSKNNDISCSTCHQPAIYFTDAIAISSAGDTKTPLERHSPTLVNLAWSPFLFWDGGAQDLESQAFQPLTHGDEMASDLETLSKELRSHSEYSSLFKKAFNTDSISSAHIVRALAQFQRTIVSYESKYDNVINGTESFNELEEAGFQIFNENCGICHQPPLFTDNSFHNNGIDSAYSWEEDGIYLGRYRITHDERDIGKFKTPTLRNIVKTAPYMHDGRFSSLDEVIDHYRTGILPSQTLDTVFTVDKVELSNKDKKALISFLETLTDQNFIQKQLN